MLRAMASSSPVPPALQPHEGLEHPLQVDLRGTPRPMTPVMVAAVVVVLIVVDAAAVFPIVVIVDGLPLGARESRSTRGLSDSPPANRIHWSCLYHARSNATVFLSACSNAFRATFLSSSTV